MEKLLCPKCGDELMQQVNLINMNCVRCGETVKKNVITLKPESIKVTENLPQVLKESDVLSITDLILSIYKRKLPD